jgi:hypothetical protein
VRSHLVGALLAIAAPFVVLADRGAFSVDAGAVLSATRVPPGVGNGDSVFGSLAGATLGARYAFRNYLEVSANAVWFQGAPLSTGASFRSCSSRSNCRTSESGPQSGGPDGAHAHPGGNG